MSKDLIHSDATHEFTIYDQELMGNSVDRPGVQFTIEDNVSNPVARDVPDDVADALLEHGHIVEYDEDTHFTGDYSEDVEPAADGDGADGADAAVEANDSEDVGSDSENVPTARTGSINAENDTDADAEDDGGDVGGGYGTGGYAQPPEDATADADADADTEDAEDAARRAVGGGSNVTDADPEDDAEDDDGPHP